jgi:hypothetical protein
MRTRLPIPCGEARKMISLLVADKSYLRADKVVHLAPLRARRTTRLRSTWYLALVPLHAAYSIW